MKKKNRRPQRKTENNKTVPPSLFPLLSSVLILIRVIRVIRGFWSSWRKSSLGSDSQVKSAGSTFDLGCGVVCRLDRLSGAFGRHLPSTCPPFPPPVLVLSRRPDLPTVSS